MNWDEHTGSGRAFWAFQGLRRIPDKGKVSGICAGIAQHWGVRLKLVRVAAVLGLIFAPMFTLIAYGLGTFFLKPADQARAEPTKAAQSQDDWATGGLPPDLSFPNLRAKFKDLEERAGAMENQVTSREFQLRRDFRQMGSA
ncbi:PspC domain-containing protein [Dongia rigui]|uniref:PspC domain-containing protein n=1 Tax=Dongia rigui TaxID=940149 RepID=A0ABU5E0F7_9PROT|nr:PspC domain-containing protein [Dongia rigui]MDY0873025.1 PspC domain-containing protein [Dongia rigui]